MQKAVRPTFADGKTDLGSLPEYEIGKRKTDRRKEAQTAPPERLPHNSALNRGSKFNSVKVCRSRFTSRRRQWMRPKSAALCTCARYGATPKHRTLSVGARAAGMSVAPESPTASRRCTQIYPQNCKWKMPTADAMLLSPAVGASARAKVVFGCENSSQSSGNNHVSPDPKQWKCATQDES